MFQFVRNKALLISVSLIVRDKAVLINVSLIVRNKVKTRPCPQTTAFEWQISDRVQCYFTSTENARTIRDEKPRTSTSTFTQLLSSEFEFSVT